MMKREEFIEALSEYLKLVNYDIQTLPDFQVGKMWADFIESATELNIYDWIKAKLPMYKWDIGKACWTKYLDEGFVIYNVNGFEIEFPPFDNVALTPLGMDAISLVDIAIDRLMDRRKALVQDLAKTSQKYTIVPDGKLTWKTNLVIGFDVNIKKVEEP